MQQPIFAITGSPGTGKTTLSAQFSADRFDCFTVEQIATQLGCLYSQDGDVLVPTNLLSNWKYSGEKIAIIEGHLSHYCTVDALIVLRCHPHELERRLSRRDGYDAAKIQNNTEWEMVSGVWSELIEQCPDLPILELDMTKGGDEMKSIETFLSNYAGKKTVQESITLAIDWLEG